MKLVPYCLLWVILSERLRCVHTAFSGGSFEYQQGDLFSEGPAVRDDIERKSRKEQCFFEARSCERARRVRISA